MSVKSPFFGTYTTVEVIKSSRMFPFKMAFNTLSNMHAKPFPSRGHLHRIIALYTSPPIPARPNPFPFAIVFTIFCTSLPVLSAFQYSSLSHIPYLCFEVSSPSNFSQYKKSLLWPSPFHPTIYRIVLRPSFTHFHFVGTQLTTWRILSLSPSPSYSSPRTAVSQSIATVCDCHSGSGIQYRYQSLELSLPPCSVLWLVSTSSSGPSPSPIVSLLCVSF